MKTLTPIEMLKEIEAFLSFKLTISDKPVIELKDIRNMKKDIELCIETHDDLIQQFKKQACKEAVIPLCKEEIKTIPMYTKGLRSCKCIKAPTGEHGLEGYAIGEIYYCEYRDGNKNLKSYWRIWPVVPESKDPVNDYYETCGPIVFKRFFVLL